MAKRRGGRPPKLTPEVAEKILLFLKLGNSQKAAAQAAGVSESALQKWLAQGEREGTGRFFQFLQDVRRAQAEWQSAMVKTIQQAALGKDGKGLKWQAAAWLLERRDPKNWAQRTPAEGAAEELAAQQQVEEEDPLERALRDAQAAELLDQLAQRLEQERLEG